jgi:outer membrane protein TolC
MTIFSRLYWPVAWFACSAGIAFAAPIQQQAESSQSAVQTSHQVDHFDELKVNPSLQLSEVLEKAYARAPMQASLQSRDVMVSAKNRVANAMLPSAPAVGVIHQNDAIGSGRGERDWQAELELPVWQPKQRNNRLKVAEAIQSSTSASRQSLKLQVAGQLREALWNIAANDTSLSLAINKLQVAKNLQSDVGKRYRAGELAKTDAMLAEQEVLRVEKEKVRAEAELMHARHRYYLLTGLRELPASYEEQQSSLEDYSQSPIWLEAQSKLGLAETERDLAQVESHENMRVLLNVRNSKGAFDTTDNNSVGVHVRVPFGGEASAAPIRAAAEMVVGNALTEREAMRFELEAAMHEAEHNLSVSRAELNIATKQHEIAKESLTLAQKAFQLGETDLVSLLRVQAQTFEAARAFTTRQIQVQWDIARYNQTVGVLP